jgi:hypothetical protein
LIGTGDVKQSAFAVDQSKDLRLVAYNFGDKPARGKLSIEGASSAAAEIEIAPGGREERTIRSTGAEKVTARLDLGEIGTAIVWARVTTAPTTQPDK